MAYRQKGWSAFSKKTDPPKKSTFKIEPQLLPYVKEIRPTFVPRQELTPPTSPPAWNTKNDMRPQMKNIAKTPKIESVKLPRYKKKK
tara:strand:+ start:2031 stop:2291 length:261 start_codon:yes stop_codon:yes gene_type:complete